MRASGSGHSPSDLVCTKDYIINLDGMQQILQVSELNRVDLFFLVFGELRPAGIGGMEEMGRC